MITVTRSLVRRLRQVLRRSTLGITHRGIISELVLRAEGAQLRAQHRYCDLAVEHVEPGSYRPATSIAIPLDALAECQDCDIYFDVQDNDVFPASSRAAESPSPTRRRYIPA